MYPMGEWARGQLRAREVWEQRAKEKRAKDLMPSVPATFEAVIQGRLAFYRHLYQTGRLAP